MLLNRSLGNRKQKVVEDSFVQRERKKKEQVKPVPKPAKQKLDLKKNPIEVIVHLDSRSRDYATYPKACEMTLSLGDTFQNVSKVQLMTLELPNAAQVVNTSNNAFQWRDQYERNIQTVQVDILQPNELTITCSKPHLLNTAKVTCIIVFCPVLSWLEGDHQVDIINAYKVRLYVDTTGLPPLFTMKVDFGAPRYSVSVTPGNYAIDTISTQLQTLINQTQNQNGVYHTFIVSSDRSTDILEFQSFQTQALRNNPLSTVIDTTLVTVLINNHGLKTGDSFALFGCTPVANYLDTDLNGVHTVVGFTDTTFTFDIGLPATSTSSGGSNTVLLGRPVNFQVLFNLKTRENLSTAGNFIGQILGFPIENSSVGIDSSKVSAVQASVINMVPFNGNCLVTVDTGLPLVPNTIYTVSGLTDDLITLDKPHELTLDQMVYLTCDQYHGYVYVHPWSSTKLQIVNNTFSVITNGQILLYGDKIQIHHVQSVPQFEANATFFVMNVLSSTQFVIRYPLQKVISISPDAKVQTSFVRVQKNLHGFNEITNIQSLVGNRVKITTKVPIPFTGSIIENVITKQLTPGRLNLIINNHGLSTQSFIFIENNNFDATFSGPHVINVIDSNTIQVIYSPILTAPSAFCTISYGHRVTIAQTNCLPRLYGQYGINTNLTGSNEFIIYVSDPLTQSGTRGILNYANEVTVSRATGTIPYFPMTQKLNGQTFGIRVNSENDYFVETLDLFSDSSTGGTLSNFRVSSENDGYRNVQSNTVSWEGNDTLYRRVTLQGENYVFLVEPTLGKSISNDQKNVFEKVPLDVNPGAIVFHREFEPIVYDPPIPMLKEVSLMLKTFNGDLFDILRLDYSLTLKLVCENTSFEQVNLNERQNHGRKKK